MLSLLLLHLFLAGVRLLTGRLHGVQDKWDAFWWCQCRYQPHPSGLMAQSLLFNPLYLLLMHYPSLQCVLLLWDLILSTLSGHALFSPIPACLMRWCISLSSNFPEQRRRLLGAHLNWKQDQIWPDPPLALIFSNFSCWNDKLYQNKLSKELWWFTLAVDLALWRYPEYISINIISLQAPQHQLFLSCFINIHLKEDRPLKKNKTRIGIACCRGFVRTTLPFIVPQICDLSLTKLPHFFFPITETIQETSAVLQNKSMVRWKWMWGSKTLCKEKKKRSRNYQQKSLSRWQVPHVWFLWICLVWLALHLPSIIEVYCVGNHSPNWENALLLLRPFVRAREWECFVSGVNHAPVHFLMLARLFSDLDMLQWTLFNHLSCCP